MPRKSSSTAVNQNLLLLHFTVFIWGFTGILGKLISVAAVQLVWYRVLIASATLFLYFKFRRTDFGVSRNSFFQLVLTGALVGGHWILFFLAIKLSTVSVALVCLSSLTLFTAVLEPLIASRRISRLEIIAGMLIVAGIIIIFRFETQYTKGIVAGLISAVLASLFSIFNSKHIRRYAAPVIAFYELSGAFFWISVFLLATGGFGIGMRLKATDVAYLLLLGTICTSLAYVAGVSVMKELSAFRVALVTNLEPVYGILLSFAFFGDMNQLTAGFWVGAGLVLSTIFLFPLAKKQLDKRRARR